MPTHGAQDNKKVFSAPMQSPAKSSLLRTTIRKPLVALVLLLALGLTSLFYYSQKRDFEVHARFMESLHEYKFLDAKLMSSLGRARYDLSEDSAAIVAEAMVLREIAVSLYTSADKFRSQDDWMPEENRFNSFEREVINKVSMLNRFLRERRAWLRDYYAVSASVSELPGELAQPVFALLDSARLGNVVQADSAALPDSLKETVLPLLQRNAELASLYDHVAHSRAVLWAEELILDFKAANTDSQNRNFTISFVFYLFSLVLLLLTLFLYVRGKDDNS